MKVLSRQSQWGNTTKEERRQKCKSHQEAMCKARRKRIEIVTPEARYEFVSLAAASAALGIPNQTISFRLTHPDGKGTGQRNRKNKHDFQARYI